MREVMGCDNPAPYPMCCGSATRLSRRGHAPTACPAGRVPPGVAMAREGLSTLPVRRLAPAKIGNALDFIDAEMAAKQERLNKKGPVSRVGYVRIEVQVDDSQVQRLDSAVQHLKTQMTALDGDQQRFSRRANINKETAQLAAQSKAQRVSTRGRPKPSPTGYREQEAQRSLESIRTHRRQFPRRTKDCQTKGLNALRSRASQAPWPVSDHQPDHQTSGRCSDSGGSDCSRHAARLEDGTVGL